VRQLPLPSAWRAAQPAAADFYVAAIFAFCSATALAILYNPPPTPNPAGRSYLDRWLDFDRIGTLLFIAGVTPLLLGLTWGGGGAYPWSSAHGIAPTVVGGVMLLVFVAYEAFIKKDGLAHHGLFSLSRCVRGGDLLKPMLTLWQ
jgi:hypothetical protein